MGRAGYGPSVCHLQRGQKRTGGYQRVVERGYLEPRPVEARQVQRARRTGDAMSDFPATDLPLPVSIPKQLGLEFNKTSLQLV